jgi:DNA-binding GntR family transcriptional regulator
MAKQFLSVTGRQQAGPRAPGDPNPDPRHVPASERAYAFVKERLLDGRYPGGTLLSENELARRLGISRTPMRQAFLQLEAEEMLDLYPRRGALVRPITPSEAEDVLEARLLIEAHCARRVATQGTALADALAACIAAQEASLAQAGVGFTLADREFHRTIVSADGNEILTRQHDALRDRQQRIAATAVAQDPARIEGFISEHRSIAAAIAAGDAGQAQERTTAHLRSAHELARRPRP